MVKIRKYKNAIERFLSGENGQRFFNFAYSIGAAIVIWGALFKILHLPGGNTLLCIGMGTEVMMFILTAFDRPGRDYHWEEVFPVFNTKDPDDHPEFGHDNVVIGGTTMVGGLVTGHEGAVAAQPQATPVTRAARTVVPELSDNADAAEVTEHYIAQMKSIAEQMQTLKETTEALNQVSSTLLESYRAITENSENITASATGYVDQMQALARNVSGLNTIYEIQLKSVSSQLDSIDHVNHGIKQMSRMYEDTAAKSERYCEETEKMAENMRQLNRVYEKMLKAMTVNMYRPMPGAEMTEDNL